ncbi:hypothetical protein QR680_006598 [Steinernema hermaphroditum]|uniref:Uncharacterized protein n=1 Tax=Steinernema hermaphroditum TaxID=289476 RepID=A0AA39HX74_9BILA|nr:hypothetical protein QR680_006598 [Steinernema hermaphroditum]
MSTRAAPQRHANKGTQRSGPHASSSRLKMNTPVQWGVSQMNRRMAIFNSVLIPGIAFEFTVHRQQTKTGTATVRCQRCLAANRKRQKYGLEKSTTAYQHVSGLEDGAVWLGDPDTGHGCLDDGMVDCTEARTLARQTYKKAVNEIEQNPCSYEEAYSHILQNVEETSSASLNDILAKLPSERTARHTIARHLQKAQKDAESELLKEMDTNGFSTPLFPRVDEDDESEATRLFSQRVNKEYERDYGPPSSAVSRKLNFDDTMMSERSTSSRLVETEEELSSFKRLLKRSREELAHARKREETTTEKVRELEKKLNETKELNDKFRRFSEVRDNKNLRNKLQFDELKAVAGKYHTWHQFSQAQIQCAKEILQKANLWNRENRSKLYVSYMQIPPTELKEEELAELAKGSVQDYPAIEEYASLEHDDTQDSEGYDSSNFTGRLKEDEQEQQESMGSQQSQVTVVPSMLNETDHNLSCNAQELMICRLREECEELKKRCEGASQRLLLANDQVRKSLLLREQKMDLERQLEKEKGENAALHLKLEKMKDAIKNQILSDNLTSPKRSTANEVIENVIAVKTKNKELEKRIAEFMVMEREFARMRDKFSRLEAENRELRVKAHTGRVAEAMLEEKQREIRDLREEIRRLQPLETDAGETTKILHFAHNPIEEAHEEMKKQEAHKRARQDSSSDSSDDNGAKRRREEDDEEVEDLKRRLQKTEGNLKAAATEYQQVAQRYRRWCQNLTGYQIKMRDQSFCEVESIYDPGKSFSFKYNDENGAYELLETEYIERWSEQVETYLDCGHSIPAFLASVTLELEQEAANLSRI